MTAEHLTRLQAAAAALTQALEQFQTASADCALAETQVQAALRERDETLVELRQSRQRLDRADGEFRALLEGDHAQHGAD